MTGPVPLEPGRAEVSFIGLGIMGKPMARNLLAAGYALRVHNRSRGAVEDLVREGAAGAETPAESSRGAAVTVTMLPDSEAVRQVVLGPSGVAEAVGPGHILIDMSTISPAAALEMGRSLASRGSHMLDAPVSGGERGAIEATLSIMAGGESAAFRAARPLLEKLGNLVVHVGPPGAGQIAKACNQVVVGVTIQAVSEALILAQRAGADPARVREALLGGFAQSRVLEVHGLRMLKQDFKPGGRVELHHKDLGIALEVGREAGTPLPATALVEQLMGILRATGRGHLDQSALGLLMEEMAEMPEPPREGPAGEEGSHD